MRAARMESWIDKIIFVAPVEGIFHFVAVVEILAIGDSGLDGGINIGKVNLTESNFIPDNENNKPEIIIKQGLTKPKEEKKESYSKNNFYNMRAKKNKNILPKVNRAQKTIILKTNIPNNIAEILTTFSIPLAPIC